MYEYFGKCFGLFTRASNFLTQMPQLFIIKICFKLKLIQSVVRVGILGISVASSILRVLLSGFWASGSQFPSPRDPFPGSWVSGSQFHGSESQGLVIQNRGSQGLRIPGLGVPGSWVSESWGLRSHGPRSRVLGPDFRLYHILTILTCPLKTYVVRLRNLISMNNFFTIDHKRS